MALVLFTPTGPLVADDDADKAALEAKAERLFEELQKSEKRYGKQSVESQHIRVAIADTLMDLRLPKKAANLYLQAEAVFSERLPATEQELVRLRCRIADALDDSDRTDRAIRFLTERSTEFQNDRGEGDSPEQRQRIAWVQSSYGRRLHGLGAFSESLAMYRGAHAIHSDLDGPEDLNTLVAAIGVGACGIELGRWDEVRDLTRTTLELLTEHHSGQLGLIRTCRNNIAVIYRHFDEHEKALGVFEAIIAAYDEEKVPPTNEQRLLAVENRIHCLADLHRYAEAVEQVEAHIEVLEGIRPKGRWKDEIRDLEKSRRLWFRKARGEEDSDGGEQRTPMVRT